MSQQRDGGSPTAAAGLDEGQLLPEGNPEGHQGRCDGANADNTISELGAEELLGEPQVVCAVDEIAAVAEGIEVQFTLSDVIGFSFSGLLRQLLEDLLELDNKAGHDRREPELVLEQGHLGGLCGECLELGKPGQVVEEPTGSHQEAGKSLGIVVKSGLLGKTGLDLDPLIQPLQHLDGLASSRGATLNALQASEQRSALDALGEHDVGNKPRPELRDLENLVSGIILTQDLGDLHQSGLRSGVLGHCC